MIVAHRSKNNFDECRVTKAVFACILQDNFSRARDKRVYLVYKVMWVFRNERSKIRRIHSVSILDSHSVINNCPGVVKNSKTA